MEHERAIAAIERLRGKVERSGESADQRVVGVNLHGIPLADADLGHLTGLTDLLRLNLFATGTTDDGLRNLESLARLQWLDLAHNPISDSGLLHLTGLTDLQSLDLARTRITDAGLSHLKRLTNLRWVDVTHNEVTDAGIRELEEALPSARVIR